MKPVSPLPPSLKAQFTLGLLGLVLLGAAGGGVAVAALRRSADGTRRLAEERLTRLEDAQQLVGVTAHVQREADGLVTASTVEALGAAHGELSRQLDALDALVERLGGSSASVSVLHLHESGQAVRNTVHVVARLRGQLLHSDATSGGRDRADQEANLRAFHAELQRDDAALIASAQAISADSAREYREAVQALARASARDEALVFGFLVASAVAAFAIARLFLGRRVLGRLQQVSDHLRQRDPAAADSPRLPVNGADEIAEMARAVEQFLEDRRRLAEADREAERSENLRRSERSLRAVVDTVPAHVWSASPDGAVDFVNERLVKFMGVSPDEIMGWKWERAVHPDDRAGFVAAWRVALSAGRPMEGEIRLRRADGSYTWFLVRNFPLREEGGNVVRWFGSAVEIEDRKRVELERERHRAEITALNERLMKAQEEERSRIAGELHDSIAQQMTTVNLLLGATKRQVPLDSRTKAAIDEAQEMLIEMGSDIRHLSHELHPALLKDAGLPDALSAYCTEFMNTRGIPVTCEADAGVKELSPGAALALYRIAQEALGNAAKHAKAKQVRVLLEKIDGGVRLIVADDGVGFVPDGSGHSGGVGLVNMRERLRQLNGTFELESEPGRGTTIRAAVPFRPA